MKGYILILGSFGSSAAGTAAGMVIDKVLTNGQELFAASIIGAILGNLLGWYLFKQSGLLDGKASRQQADRTL